MKKKKKKKKKNKKEKLNVHYNGQRVPTTQGSSMALLKEGI